MRDTSRLFCLWSGIIGCIVMAVLLVMLLTQRSAVEALFQRFVIYEVETHVADILQEDPDDRGVNRLIGQLGTRFSGQADAFQDAVATHLPFVVTQLLGDKCRHACVARAGTGPRLAGAMIDAVKALKYRGQTVEVIVNDKYDRSVDHVLRDFAIFALTNAVAFGLLALLAAFRGTTARYLSVFCWMLLASGAGAASIFLFGQDWASNILFGRTIGWAYAVWMAIIFAFFFDQIFLRGFFTTLVMEAIGAMLRALASLTPG